MILDVSDSPTEANVTVKTVKTIPLEAKTNDVNSQNSDFKVLHRMRVASNLSTKYLPHIPIRFKSNKRS